MRKTTIQWLAELPPEIAEKAIRNHNAVSRKHGYNVYYDSLEGALQGAFIFDETEEGINYWMKVLNELP